MPMLSHLHQLFNAEQCQAYIHTLRWKDRPLQCPRCQSDHIGRWGTYQYRPGCQTLLVSRLQAHLQRPHRDPAPPEPAVTVALDSRDVSALSRLLVPAHRQGGGGAYPDQLSLVLVDPQCRLVL